MPNADTDHRSRILLALADVLMTRRYSDVTIADIAAQARTSKRTFYEQFASKEACLLALCEQTSDQIMFAILAAYRPGMPWTDVVREVTRGYLNVIRCAPSLMHALYIELLATGAPGLAARRAVSMRFAQFLCDQVEVLRAEGEPLRSLSLPMAVAVIAGINELILMAMMDNSDLPNLMDLAEPAMALVHAVTRP